MKKIFGKINRYARVVINMLIRFILALLYFTLFFILGILIRKYADFLNTKKRDPAWFPHEAIKDAGKFLLGQ
jgi:preprotein translocase subunit SecG